MRLNRSLGLGVIVFAGYLAALAATDSDSGIVARVGEIGGVLPVLLLTSLVAFAIRSFRCYLILTSLGHRLPIGPSFLAYVAGFAFTATPGKVGELLRIRYFARWGVGHEHVIAVFVFERMLDLLVLLLFALPIGYAGTSLGIAGAFVFSVIATIIVAARWRGLRFWLIRWFEHPVWQKPARLVHAVLRGLAQLVKLTKPADLATAAVLGLLAWGVQCCGFLLALRGLGIDIPVLQAFAVQPAAILLGAASMIPGGIGSTEAASAFLLHHFGVALPQAALAAIALRIGSLWFAIGVGACAAIYLEYPRPNPSTVISARTTEREAQRGRT